MKRSEDTIKKMKESCKEKLRFNYTILCPNGELVETKNLNEFAEKNNIHTSSLRRTIVGFYKNGDKCTHAKGYKLISKVKLK